MIASRAVLRALLLVATAGLLSQAVFEFGPLWLVALAAPAVLYGPYWAALVSTLGVGGLLISKLHVERRLMLAVLITVSVATALLLTWTRSLSVRASRGMEPVEVAATAKQEAIEVTTRAQELACRQLVELVADYLDDALSAELKAKFEEHIAGCDGCTAYLSQTQQIITELQGLAAAPDTDEGVQHTAG